jgi:hypothetical protein
MNMLPQNAHTSKAGHSKGQVSWQLPTDGQLAAMWEANMLKNGCQVHYTAQEQDATVLLGHKDIADDQHAADMARGGYAAVLCSPAFEYSDATKQALAELEARKAARRARKGA